MALFPPKVLNGEGLERINRISFISYGKIRFELRVFRYTSDLSERIKLVSRGTTVFGLEMKVGYKLLYDDHMTLELSLVETNKQCR